MDKLSKTILDILLETNRLTQTEASGFGMYLRNAEIEEKLRKRNLVSSEDIAKAYSILYDLPLIRLENLSIAPDVYKLIPRDLIDKYDLIAFEKEGATAGAKVKIAIGKPANLNQNTQEVIDYLKKNKNILAELYITTEEDIRNAKKHLEQIPDKEIKETPVEEIKPKKLDYTNLNLSGIKTVDLKNIKIPYDVISKFPIEISIRHNMIVFDNPSPNLIKVAVSDPFNGKVREILDFVKVKNDIAIQEYVASPPEINEAIKLYYRKPIVSPPVISPPKIISDKKNIMPQAPQTPLPTKIPPPQLPQTPQAPRYSPGPISPQAPRQATSQTQAQQKEKTQEEELRAPQENNLDQFIGREVKDINVLREIAQGGDIPKILAATVALATFKKASDIHIEAEEKDVRVRYRIDGILRDVIRLPLQIGPAIISRIKILSRLKIDESRVPQDGRFDAVSNGHQIDLRISTLPTVHGEKAAIRILDKTQNIFNLKEIGLSGRGLEALEKNITKPYGIILVTGPTGSGKSTTLYSILQQISTPKINVVTLEDPVEYEIPGINQCQIKPKIGFSFAEGLRSILRQDPNVIMVGEIRDAETAGMATHAALTGHLVLTTLHTNDAAGALPRLINMGIEPFLITSSINVIVAQRLVRRICQKCKQKITLPDQLMAEISAQLGGFNLPKPFQFYEAKGCPECTQGYSGRIGIYEVLEMSDKIEDLAVKRRPASEIAKQAGLEHMTTLKQDGLIKAARGITTVSEVLRVTEMD